MKKYLKKFLIVAMLITSLLVGGLIYNKRSTAYADTNFSGSWYYSQLSHQEKTFYDALRIAYNTEQLMSGNASIDVSDAGYVSNYLSQDAIKDCVINGNNSIMTSFEKAKTAFRYDFAQTSFINFDKLTLSLGLTEDAGSSKYVAIIGSGKNSSYFAEGYTSKEQTLSLLATTSSKVKEIIVELQAEINLPSKIRKAYQILTQNTTFVQDYEVADASKVYINSAYGLLTNNKANAEGYARTMSMILNELGVANVIVNGNVISSDFNLQKHVYNYVNLDGAWYGLDCALDDTETKLEHTGNYLKGAQEFLVSHNITTPNFAQASNFDYPTLANTNYNYNCDFDIQASTVMDIGLKFHSKFTVSYNNQGLEELAKKGLYVVVRNQSLDEDEQLVWSDWTLIDQYFVEGNAYNKDFSTHFEYEGHEYLNQFAITDVNILAKTPTDFVDEDNSGDNIYNYNKLVDFDQNNYFICMSDQIKGSAKNKETKPMIESATPTTSQYLSQGGVYNISIIYDQPLNFKPGYTDKDIKVTVTSNPVQAVNNSVISNIKWDHRHTVSFTFMPTLNYYEPFYECTFEIEGLYGNVSHLALQSVSYTVIADSSYQGEAAELDNFYYSTNPVIIKNKNNTYSQESTVIESSQDNLLLVNSAISTTTIDGINSLIKLDLGTDQANINVYNLKLYLSGLQVQPSTNSTIIFTYPDNTRHSNKQYCLYYFDTNGITLTPSKINLTATAYGLVSVVNKVGLFAVVEVDSGIGAAAKNLFVSCDDNGTISDVGYNAMTGSKTFTITPNSGYRIFKISLNNNNIALDEAQLAQPSCDITIDIASLTSNNDLRVEFKANDTLATNPNTTMFNQKHYNQTPVIVRQPQGTTITKGKTLTLSVDCYTNSYAELTYQWYKDGQIIEGATQSTYSTRVVQQTQGEYYVKITSSIDGSTLTVDSVTCKVNLNNYLVVWALSIFFVIVVVVSLFVLIMTKKFNIPTVKSE